MCVKGRDGRGREGRHDEGKKRMRLGHCEVWWGKMGTQNSSEETASLLLHGVSSVQQFTERGREEERDGGRMRGRPFVRIKTLSNFAATR